MSDLYEEITKQENTSRTLDTNRIVNFAYDDKAFKDNIVKWQGYYNYNAHNNIPESSGVAQEVLDTGLGRRSGVLKRTFINHYMGRISYNLNKAVQALLHLLETFRADYRENISEYSEDAYYHVGDVCFRLAGDTIMFYRCISDTSGGAFDGRYWETPEEELSYYRPAVGVPMLWFEEVPDWAIRFDDGGHHSWADVPALNFSDFRNLVTIDADDTGFTVPEYTGRVPMFTGGDNTVLPGYSGNTFDAALQGHTHGSVETSFKLAASTKEHVHATTMSSEAPAHTHEITVKCQYNGTDNRQQNRIPVDDITRYNPETLTQPAGAHRHVSNDLINPNGASLTSSGVEAHTHQVLVGGHTGAVVESTGGNPDGFQSCWIVRYK